MQQTTPAQNYHSQWPHGPLNYRSPALALQGPALPPVTRASARAGLRFQQQLCDNLRDTYPSLAICPDWWFEYSLYDKVHKAGPDILLLDPKRGLCIIIECKLTYTDAYKQLFLYMSLLRSLLPHPLWTVAGFLAYKQPTHLPIVQAGPNRHLMSNPIRIEDFRWAGHDLPTIGVFGSDFIPTPRFAWKSEDLFS